MQYTWTMMTKMVMLKFRQHMNNRKGMRIRQKRQSMKDVKSIFNGDEKNDSFENTIIDETK